MPEDDREENPIAQMLDTQKLLHSVKNTLSAKTEESSRVPVVDASGQPLLDSRGRPKIVWQTKDVKIPGLKPILYESGIEVAMETLGSAILDQALLTNMSDKEILLVTLDAISTLNTKITTHSKEYGILTDVDFSRWYGSTKDIRRLIFTFYKACKNFAKWSGGAMGVEYQEDRGEKRFSYLRNLFARRQRYQQTPNVSSEQLG
jgi:hypothetical protein